MTPAAVGNQDTTAAICNGPGRILIDATTAAHTGLEAPPQGRRSGAGWTAAAGLVKSWMATFTQKKVAAPCG